MSASVKENRKNDRRRQKKYLAEGGSPILIKGTQTSKRGSKTYRSPWATKPLKGDGKIPEQLF